MRPLVRAAFVVLAAAASPAVRADSPERERVEDVFLTEAAALREIFTRGESVERTVIVLSPDERRRVEARSGRRLFEDRFDLFRGLDPDGRVAGYAVVTEEIGKYQPITFIVGVTPESSVKDVAVMVYRESVGNDVRRRRFLGQFVGKGKDAPLLLNRDVINISGATLSSRAIARGVKKVLAAVEECVTGPRRRAEIAWRPHAPAPPARESESSGLAPPVRRTHCAMGTLLEIAAYGERETAESALADAFAEVARLEDLLSSFRPGSEISRVNAGAADGPVAVSRDTFECVAAALAFARASGGAFDPTLAPRGHEDVVLDPERRSIAFARKGLALDLGGIGKGFALDRAARALERRSVTRACLDFGGQILALDAPPGRPAGWVVAVRDPGSDDGVLGYYEIARASVSTSAAYERGPHVVDPATGRPASAALSATVVAQSATDADALSTALDVLGPERGLALVAARPGASALVVPAAGGAPLAAAFPGAPSFVAIPPE